MSDAKSQVRVRYVGMVNLGLGSLFLVIIVLALNWLSFRHYARFDWTSQGIYTLSDRTERELHGLSRPIDIYLFLSDREANFPEVKELLDRYRAATPKITVHVVDPERHPAEYRLVASRFGVNAVVMDSGQGAEEMADVAAVVTAGERIWKITRDDLLGVDYGSFEDEDGPKVDVKAEQALTGAIVQVTTGRATHVCVASGHGEWTLDGADESLAEMRTILQRENVELEAFATLGAPRVPEGCDAVLVIGPARAYTEQEATLLGRYVRAGGRLLVAAGPHVEVDHIDPTGLEAMLRGFGITMDASVVVELDTAKLLSDNPLDAFLVDAYGQHPVTRALAGGDARTLLADISRTVRPSDDRAVELFHASERAYGETNVANLAAGEEPARGEGDITPVSLGAAMTIEGSGEGAREGRVVVIGNHAFLAGPLLQSPQFTNHELLLGVLGWLTERDALISIPPKQVQAEPTTITEGDLLGLAFRVLVILPAAFLLAGFAVWWSRRS